MELEAEWTALVPAISDIRHRPLRESVCATWQEAMVRSGYDSVDDVPQSPHMTERSLLLHVNEVCTAVPPFLRLAQELFGLAPDPDVTMAAAVLHDVDKPLLYRRKGQAVEYAAGRDADSHGPLGAELSLAHGVPPDVAELVRYHSPFRAGRGLPGTVEGTVVYYADLASADLSLLRHGKAPFHALMRMTPRRRA